MLTATPLSLPLGRLSNGGQTHFSYTLVNSGPDPISISRVQPGCGSCTQASVSETQLAPGAQATVYCVFTPGGTGLQSKLVHIYYNQDKQFLTLKFTADVY